MTPLETAHAKQDFVDLLQGDVAAVHRSLLDLATRHGADIEDLEAARRSSAENLLHYLALRRHDLREVQGALATLGLSSLGRAEASVHHNLDAVLRALDALAGREPAPCPLRTSLAPVEARRILRERAEALLGPARPGRSVRIMVTLASDAATNPTIARDLIAAGMDVCRVNCAHDSPEVWRAMVGNVKAASRASGRACRIVMDLPGPKVRTGPIAAGPAVVSWRPRRDALGAVVEPARVWLTAAQAPAPPPSPATAVLPLPARSLGELRSGDRIELSDARGKARELEVAEIGAAGGGVWARATRTAYVVPETVFVVRRKKRALDRFAPGPLPHVEGAIPLVLGDRLLLATDPTPGTAAVLDPESRVQVPARVPITLPAALANVRAGHSVWFDDGKIGAIVESVDGKDALVRVTSCRPKGTKLRADRGINLPDTDLPLPAIGPDDARDLEFIVQHADTIGFSFVRTPADIADLESRLEALGATGMGLILKIETRRAFDELPGLLLAALRHGNTGVMIARGDLAIECGWERLAEVQEEILWMCEAAHLPVVWATQVLEGLTKKGRPSRSEITDAAMGERAECVMLNKGPYLAQAVRALDDILRRMEAHQSKKRPMLRALNLARTFDEPAAN